MTNIDLDGLSLKELKALQKSVEKAIASFEDRKKSEARAKLEEVAKELGYSLADLAGGPAKPKRAVDAKYRHPENSSLTWTGRGRKPKWFSEWLGAGKSADDLKIG